MKRLIQGWLGIDVILAHLHDIRNNRLDDRRLLNSLVEGIGKSNGQAIAANRGVGRLIAKLDPEFGRSEFDPKRRAESDKLSDEIIQKLIAEHVASNRSTGSF